MSNPTGGTFKLTWSAPDPADFVTAVNIFEHVGGVYNQVGSVPQPTNEITLSGVVPGVHAYVAKAHNAAGDSQNPSNEVSVTVLGLPAAIQNLAFAIV